MNQDQDSNAKIFLSVLAIAVVLIAVFYTVITKERPETGSQASTTTTNLIEVKSEEKPIEKTPKQDTVTAQVGYNGDDLYIVSIPTGNSSICIWNMHGGSGYIPNQESTTARNTEKHIFIIDGFYDFSVSCTDDLGKVYKVILPRI